MVEVQEHAITALLLPPVGGHHVRHTPPKFPGSRDHGVTDVQELMRRLDWGEDVQPLLPDVLMKSLSPPPQTPLLAPRRWVWRRRSPCRAEGQDRCATDPDCPGFPRAKAMDGKPRVHLRSPDSRRRLVKNNLGVRAFTRIDHGHGPNVVGRPFRRILGKNCSPSMFPEKRCSETGRSPFAEIDASPTSAT